MKVTIRSVIRTAYTQFECFEDQQIIFRAGRTLCIKEIGKSEADFICLSKHMDKLFTFAATTNKKGAFTAEKVGKDIELALYSLHGERKSVLLTLESAFMSEVEKVQLMVDEYDNYMLYGLAQAKDSSCVFLADLGKAKLLATGYLPSFQDIRVNVFENMTLSVCGHNGSSNYLKSLQYISGKWEITE
jgi:uncharacterized protein YjaG (DUF416 family)